MIWEVWLYSKELNKSAQQNLAKAHVSLSTADPVLPLPTEPELESPGKGTTIPGGPRVQAHPRWIHYRSSTLATKRSLAVKRYNPAYGVEGTRPHASRDRFGGMPN